MKRKEARGNLPVEFADVSKAAYLISFSPAHCSVKRVLLQSQRELFSFKRDLLADVSKAAYLISFSPALNPQSSTLI
jgi:hypothetical protein